LAHPVDTIQGHRCTSQGLGAASPKNSGKSIIFRAKAKFFGQKPAAKNEKKYFFAFIKRKKRNSFCLARKSARNLGFLLIITGWSESGKVILQVSIAVFWAPSKKKTFGQRWLSPLEKIGLCAYVQGCGNRRSGGQMTPGNLAGDQTCYFDPQIFWKEIFSGTQVSWFSAKSLKLLPSAVQF